MYKFGTIIELVEGAVAALEEAVDLSAHCWPRQAPWTGTVTGTCACSVRGREDPVMRWGVTNEM